MNLLTGKKYKSAFTLSEVLIALVIIGTIAAITLPVLFANYQKQALKSSLKKNYSVLKQALDRYQAENCERLFAGDKLGNYAIKKYLIQYLNVMYDCGIGYNDSGSDKTPCVVHDSSGAGENSKIYKNYNGKSTINLQYFDDGQFVLNDGSLILIENENNSAQFSRIYISADVNGFGKKPNRLGKDLFMFQLTTEGELLTMGAKGTDYYSANNSYCSNTSSSTMNGAGCTYKVLTE